MWELDVQAHTFAGGFMDASLAKQQRRAMRRAAHIRCQAVSDRGFELLGERALDLSPRGMLLACDLPATLGEEVLVSFQTPGLHPLWLDAEAEIARIVNGYREGDPGYCLGLRFTYLERAARNELLARLAGVPPPLPQRRMPARSTRIEQQSHAVLVRSIFRVSPARGGFPAGVWSA
jgi:hypothetical protein